MIEAFQAIYTKFSATPALVVAVTDLYMTLAPPQTAFPYITYALISNPPLWVFSARAMENMTIQFSIFSDADAETEVSAIYALLASCFDNVNMPVCGDYSSVMMQRTNSVLLKPDNVWQYVVTYQFMAQEK